MHRVHIFGGGTFSHVRTHLSLCAPAFGDTAEQIYGYFNSPLLPYGSDTAPILHLTKMADRRSEMITNDDVNERIRYIFEYQNPKAIIFNVAMCDYDGQIGDVPSGRLAQRLSSREESPIIQLTPADKVLSKIKEHGPVLLVGFKTTAGSIIQEQVNMSVRQIVETGADIVIANDVVTRENILTYKNSLRIGVTSSNSPNELQNLRKHAEIPPYVSAYYGDRMQILATMCYLVAANVSQGS